jgi:hypothetical protein
MNKVQYFIWLSTQTWYGLHMEWKTSLTLALIALVALIINNPFKPKSFTHRNLLLLTPFAITLILLFIGTMFVHNNHQIEAPKWPVYLLMGVASMHIPLGFYLIWNIKEFRWSTIALNIFQIDLSRWALFVAGMSVSGDWL